MMTDKEMKKKKPMNDKEVVEKLTFALGDKSYPTKKQAKAKKIDESDEDGVDELTREQLTAYGTDADDMEGYDDDMDMDEDKKEGKKPELFRTSPMINLTIAMPGNKQKKNGRYA